MRGIKQYFLLSLILTAILPSVCIAKNIWRDCGIGALIFTETKWAAVTSNIIWDLGITGSSSTSSSEDQCAGKGASAANFIYQNYALLEEETASGNGEHLITMLNILGCDHGAHEQIIYSIREDFAKDVADPRYSEQRRIQKAKRYYDNVMNKTKDRFSRQCAVI